MQFTLEQFGDVLRVRNLAGEPYVIIGGQAVNVVDSITARRCPFWK